MLSRRQSSTKPVFPYTTAWTFSCTDCNRREGMLNEAFSCSAIVVDSFKKRPCLLNCRHSREQDAKMFACTSYMQLHNVVHKKFLNDAHGSCFRLIRLTTDEFSQSVESCTFPALTEVHLQNNIGQNVLLFHNTSQKIHVLTLINCREIFIDSMKSKATELCLIDCPTWNSTNDPRLKLVRCNKCNIFQQKKRYRVRTIEWC